MAQILVLEENRAIYSQIRECVEAKGHKAWRVCSLEEGLTFLGRYEVSLIISGVRLENADVFEFLRTVKEKKTTQNIPVVFVSANADENDRYATDVIRNAGKSLGARKYIVLPKFDANAFWKELEECFPQGASKRDALGGAVKTYSLGEVA
jgi:CheY-like chemotaxis protein